MSLRYRLGLLLATDLRQVLYHVRQAQELLEIGDTAEARQHLNLAEELLTGG